MHEVRAFAIGLLGILPQLGFVYQNYVDLPHDTADWRILFGILAASSGAAGLCFLTAQWVIRSYVLRGGRL